MALRTLLVFAAAIALALAQGSSQSLTDLINGNDQLSSLATFLESYPDLAATLYNVANATVFAPDNGAWSAFNLAGLVNPAGDSASDVAALLSYAVLPGKLTAADIGADLTFHHTLLESASYTNVSQGQVVGVRMESGNVVVSSGLQTDAVIVEADLAFAGGILNIINAVNVIPGNLSATAPSTNNLTSFLGAVQAADLTTTLDTAADVTIFAPSNAAWQATGLAIDNLTTDTLATLLQGHVIQGTVAYSSLISNRSYDTLTGSLDVTVSGQTIYVGAAKVVTPNILLSNGVLHIVDRVLTPDVIASSPSSSTGGGASGGGTSGSDTNVDGSNSGTSNTRPNNESNAGLSSGAIAGIVVGSVVAVVAVALAFFVLRRRRKRRQALEKNAGEQASDPPEMKELGDTGLPHEISGSQRPELAARSRAQELHGDGKARELHTNEHASHELP